MASSSQVPNFSFGSKNVFLTYPHCPCDPRVMQTYFQGFFTKYDVFFIAVVTELHQDKTPHVHALIQCDKRVYTKNPRHFDYQNYHPNITGAIHPQNVLDYISKDNQPITWGEFRKTKKSSTNKDDIWKEIINTSTSKEDYLQQVKDKLPGEWATKLQWIEYSANKAFPPTNNQYVQPFTQESYICPEDIQSWLNDDLYLVRFSDYQLIHNLPYYEAESNLKWLDEMARKQTLQDVQEASSSADPLELAKLPGLEVLEDTTTIMAMLTS